VNHFESKKSSKKIIRDFKRKLPLVIYCPNGLEVFPSIKMKFKNDIMFSEDSEVEKMVITWRD